MKPAYWRWRAPFGVVLAAGTAGAMLMLSAVAPADSATVPKPGKVAVPQGITAAGLHATPVFLPGSTKETVSFVLKARNLSRLEADVEGGMRGGFLSVKKFASEYGQPASRVAALRSYLADYGISSKAYADGLDVTATGTASDFDNALSVTQQQYHVKAVPASAGQAARPALTIHGTTDQPLLPRDLASIVQSILGLTNYPIFSSSAVHTITPEVKSGSRAYQLGNRTPENFAKQYDLTPLYAKGAKGQGETIGIVTYASARPSDATHFWSKILKIKTKANRITLDNVDGGSGKVSNAAGSSETMLDVEQSGALAPDANIVVYQAPNTDYGSADAWFDAASQNKASTVSTSWGESEVFNEAIGAAGEEAPAYGQMFDEAFLEMAAQGQTVFDTAGDNGPYDDSQDYPQAYTEMTVDNPGNSPWVTTAGGTTEAGEIPLLTPQGNIDVVKIAAQRAWGWDWMYPDWSLFENSSGQPYTSEAQFAADPYNAWATGGGYSTTEARPAYQNRIKNIGSYTAVPYLTPATPELFPGTQISLPTTFTTWAGASASPATAPALITGTASGRAVPDLSADADPYTGYEEYFTGFPKSEGYLEDGWGGTSFVAPQMNGAAAVIDSYLGHRLGFWNPSIYKFASGRNSPFTPLDSASASNDDLYYTGTKGHIYNPGTGLGVPNLAKLAGDFRAEG